MSQSNFHFISPLLFCPSLIQIEHATARTVQYERNVRAVLCVAAYSNLDVSVLPRFIMYAPYYFSLPYYYYLFQGEAEASYFRYRPSLLYTHRDVRCLTIHAMRCPSKRSSCVVRYEDGNVRAVCTRRRCKCIRLRNPFSLLLLSLSSLCLAVCYATCFLLLTMALQPAASTTAQGECTFC